MIQTSYPAVICNFNRLDYLKQCIYSLEHLGCEEIFILDMGSSYPPLLDWYSSCKFKVYFLENRGPRYFFDSDLLSIVKDRYFLYTDSDCVFVKECPIGVFNLWQEFIEKNPYVSKVGASIKVDDLPNHYALKWQTVGGDPYINASFSEGSKIARIAPIDTTMALYRPNTQGFKFEALRTDFPYQIRHLTFYIDYSNLSEEEVYYHKKCNEYASQVVTAKKLGLFRES